MVRAERRQGGRTPAPRVARVAVELARLGRGQGREPYRIEEPDRVLRMWFLLDAVAEERRLVSLPPESLARMQRLLKSVGGELERAVSPALADELHHLLGWGEEGPDATQVRIAYASLLGWTGGLAISMLSQLETARKSAGGVITAASSPGSGGSLGASSLPARPNMPAHGRDIRPYQAA